MSAAVALLGLAASGAVAAASDTSFLDADELGRLLLDNVVRIRALDRQEHGFGLVVGASTRHVFVATARHVVGDAADERIEVALCGGDDTAVRAAERVAGFDAGGNDVALLRFPRPAAYAPRRRALADDATVGTGQDTWLLGQAQQCGVAPRHGAVSRLRDARGNLRVEYAGALGGSSGGPVISGYGVLGLITDASDLTFTAYSSAALAALVRAQLPEAWQLEPARNIPPTDPRAAEVDLAETLNLYLFSVRNLQGLLLQPVVPQKLFFDFSRDYNVAIERFRDARDRYDGTLSRFWPAEVLPMWLALKDQLWQVHQTFWNLNAGESKAIFEQKTASADVQAQMRELDPRLQALQTGTEAFLKAMTRRSPQ